MPRSIQVGVPSGGFSVTKLMRAPRVPVGGRGAQPPLAGGRSDHHEYAWSLPSRPDDGRGLPPGPRRAGRAAGLPARGRARLGLPAAASIEAVRGGLGPPLTLFVNAEPVSLGVSCPDDLREAIEHGPPA